MNDLLLITTFVNVLKEFFFGYVAYAVSNIWMDGK